MLITVRNTLLAIAAAAGLSTSGAAQTLVDPNTGTDAAAVDIAAVDIATAASLEAAPPADNLIAPDAAYEPTPSVDAEYMATRDSLVQDNSTDPDEPPIGGEIADRATTRESVDAGAGQSTGDSNSYHSNEPIAVDHDGDYIADDWTYDDHTGFAELISSGTWLHRGRWFTQTEATLVFRSTAPRQILSDIPLIFQGQTFFSDAMTTESDGFGYEPGMRVTVGKYLGRDDQNRDRTLEFTFWGLNEWTSQYAVSAVNPSNETSLLRTPLDRGIGAYNFATGHQFSYESNLNSFEMNAKISRRLGRDRMVLKPDGRWERQCDPGRTPTFLAGFRAITIDEEFSFDAQRVGLSGISANLPDATGTYDIDAQNRLFGLQLGAELIQQHCNWSFGVRGKLGGYANFVDQTTQVRVSDTRPGLVSSVRDEQASDVQMAMGAELGLVGTYQIRPNIAFRAAYDFIYLQGLALAPQQLDFNAAPQPNVRSGSHQLLNGGTVGLEFVW